ncbi:hypothetical protein J4T99_gp058 [Mycobacterium phage Bromden]|uniref:Uncharacterized protein n=1 Tax=Mycobacterium phage Bromden TaxID=2283252 RepID=A0A345MBJ3_9CAUD|nr:hypothetical protein J4T99_gp058 [Mycobacterium phage Bromden]AXH67864.1 hypothetical protein SEA_BROMDEN_58 [Mycobacterium phage Bromden]
MTYRVEIGLKEQPIFAVIAVAEPEVSHNGILQVTLKDGYLVYAPGYWQSYGVKENKDG